MFTNCFILLGPQCDKFWHQNPLHVASLSGTHTVIKSGLQVLDVLLHPLATILSGLQTASSYWAHYFTLCFQNEVSCHAKNLVMIKYGFQVALNQLGYFSSLATSTLIMYFEKRSKCMMLIDSKIGRFSLFQRKNRWVRVVYMELCLHS